MSLDITVDHIREDLRYNEDRSDIGFMAKNIGFWTIAIDIGPIKSTTIDEWYARYEVLKAMGVNFFMDGEGNSVEITYADLVEHIGLTTNVAYRGRSQWLKFQVGGRMDDSIRDRKRAMSRALEIADEESNDIVYVDEGMSSDPDVLYDEHGKLKSS